MTEQGGYPLGNYTQTPNPFFDDDLKEMGYAEMKVALAVIRATLGHHEKGPVSLSNADLREITGMSKPGVLNGIKKALERGRIRLADEKADDGSNMYLVNFSEGGGQVTLPPGGQASRLAGGQVTLPLPYNKDSKEKEPLPDKKISGEDETFFDFPNATPLQRSKQALGWICFDNPLDKKLPAGTSKRVNTIKRELYEAYPERPKTDFSAKLFRYAARCYMDDKPPGFNMPQDAVKFLTAMRGYFEIYWTNKLDAVPVPTVSEKPMSEAEAAAKRRAAMPKPRGVKNV